MLNSSFCSCTNEAGKNDRSMERYYIATKEGGTDGPYSLNALDILCNQKRVNVETLVCMEGSQKWMKYGELLSSIAQGKASQNTDVPSIADMPETNKRDEKFYSADGISGAFKIIGSIAMIAGVILLAFCFSEKQPVGAVVYGLSGLLSCVACFWCAKVIELLCVLANKK